jgi:hypothetical protein
MVVAEMSVMELWVASSSLGDSDQICAAMVAAEMSVMD